MTRRLGLLIVVAALLATPHQAFGGERIDRKSENPDYIMWAYAKCLVERGPEKVRVVFAELPQSDESNALLKGLQWRGCLRKATVYSMQLSFNPTLIRGALAEHLLELDRDRQAESGVVSSMRIFDENAAPTRGSYDQRYDVALISASECAINATPENASALLISQPATSEGQEAMAKFPTALSPCVDEGIGIDLTQAMLRAYISEAALRLAVKESRSASEVIE